MSQRGWKGPEEKEWDMRKRPASKEDMILEAESGQRHMQLNTNICVCVVK